MRYGLVLTGVLIAVALGLASGAGAPPCLERHGARRPQPSSLSAIGTANIGVTVLTAFPLPRLWSRLWSCRNRLRPPVVVEQPVIVLAPRPASCGEYRYWNG
jgi:hypothetical protein